MLNLASLNPQQRVAVETINGPVLILAGAGTGKTGVITYRIAHMIERGIRPENILAVTFTNKAAREMQQRVGKLMQGRDQRPANPSDRPTICTFHSLCVRILRQYIDRLGYKHNFVIYDEADQLATIKKILSRISAAGEKTDPNAILSMLSRYKNAGDQSGLFADPGVRAMAEHVRSRYESALRACNAVDFDDLILLTLKLFAEHPDTLAACRAKYHYIMVDEYQDTNASQFKLVCMLTHEHRNVCVVGDDDQSIYGWRGAEIGNLLDLEKHFPGVKMIKLEQNYRSTGTILSAANAVIKNNSRRRGKELWSRNGQGSRITLHTFASDEEEARTIVEQIEYARLAGRISWVEQAILFRTNQQARALETALRQAGVRYHLIGGQSYFDRREVKDFLAFLKTFVNPHDDVSLLRIANVPARGLSDVTMERLIAASQERHCSVYSAMKNREVRALFGRKAGESVVEFLDTLETGRATLAAARGGSIPGWAEQFLERIRYFDELRRAEKDAETAENRVRNLHDLIATMGSAGSTEEPLERLQEFLEGITLDGEREEEKENTGDAVTLITMHSCKGLEFPHVYIVGLEDGLLPHSRSKTEGNLDEERRLFYVAMTRAMQTLTISYCTGRKKYGQLAPCHPSPFLAEIPLDLVEDANEKAKQPVSVGSGKNLFAAMRSSIG